MFLGYSRRETKTQTSADAVLQCATMEVWGKIAQNGATPVVQAYKTELPKEWRGIEFSTNVAPESNTGPLHARWYLGKPGVQRRIKNNDVYACISITNIKNLQP